MRFIGSKSFLLDKIEGIVNENASDGATVFCDLFSGTGAVARHFKPKYEIHANDLLHFSFVLQKASIETNREPAFDRLSRAGIKDPVKYLEETKIKQEDNFFITENYSPGGRFGRMYFSNENALRIDFIRNTVDRWKRTGLLNETEYYYLLAGLLEGVPLVSNIAGTYAAFLKYFEKRSFKEFRMLPPLVADNQRSNKSYNMDANQLIRELEGDILYLDPPYNRRQYAAEYHLLETISRNDRPEIEGVTGRRDYKADKSLFSAKRQVLEVFEDLIDRAKFSDILLSYSSDGIMTDMQIERILKKYGDESSFRKYSFPYRKYQNKPAENKRELYEHVYYIKKPKDSARYYFCIKQKFIG